MVCEKLDVSVLDAYPPGTAAIKLITISGKERIVFIAAKAGVDNEETLREHLLKYLPAAKLIGWAIK